MKSLLTLLGSLVAMAATIGATDATNAAEKSENKLVHSVYFALNDNSAEAKEKLVAACKKYLTDHPGSVAFGVGTVASELARPVNDRDFDVSLYVVFKDKASHDVYQTAPRHLKFIEENKANWKKVRVFDAYLQP